MRKKMGLTFAVIRNIVQRCARFPEILQNFSERQTLLNLCSVVFHALTFEIAYSNFTFCGA